MPLSLRQLEPARFIPAVVVGLIAIGTLLGLSLLPALESDQARLARFVARNVEHARRLLHQFNQNYVALAATEARLHAAGISLDLTDQDIARAIEQQPEAFAAFGRTTAARVQAIRQAINRINALRQDNRRALSRAVELLDQAIGKRIGQASGADSLKANYLMGLVLCHQADRLATDATAKRAQARQLRWQLLRSIQAAQAARDRLDELAAANPAQAIAQLQQQLAELTDTAARSGRVVEQLQQQVQQLQQQVAPLRNRADQARRKLAQLQASPPDPADAAAVLAYRQAYQHHASIARQATYDADALQYGTLAGAVLDRTHGGDLLKDRYVGGQLRPGLATLEKRLATARAHWQGQQASLQAMQEHIRHLQASAIALAQRRAAARQDLQTRLEALPAAIDRLRKVTAEAESLEDDALRRLASARRHLGAALRLASDARRRASQQLAAAAEGRRNPRLEVVANDRTAEADSHKALAEAFIRQGRIYLRRVIDLSQQRDALERASKFNGSELKQELAGISQRLERWRQAGLDSIDKPDSNDDATGHLQEAQKALLAMRAKYVWTVQARLGQAWYLLGQLSPTEQQRQEATKRAADELAAALKTPDGRVRGGPYVAPFAEMLSYIQRGS